MKLVCVCAMLLLLTVAPAAGSGPGPCGDVDDDPTDLVGMGDLTAIIAYLMQGGTTIPQPQDADCDGLAGISISDFYRLADWLFPPGVALDCSASGCYDLTVSLQDTVILPLARCIDLSQMVVSLTVDVRIHSAAPQFYLPIEVMGNGSNAAFVYANATANGPGAVAFGPSGEPILAGDVSQTFDLNYTRSTPGLWGWITTGVRDIDFGRKFVVQHDTYTPNQNLYRPVVLFCRPYDYPPGDIDCDCMQTISDLTILIDGLFISFMFPPACPCLP